MISSFARDYFWGKNFPLFCPCIECVATSTHGLLIKYVSKCRFCIVFVWTGSTELMKRHVEHGFKRKKRMIFTDLARRVRAFDSFQSNHVEYQLEMLDDWQIRSRKQLSLVVHHLFTKQRAKQHEQNVKISYRKAFCFANEWNIRCYWKTQLFTDSKCLVTRTAIINTNE